MPSGKRAKQQRKEAVNAPRTPPRVRSKGSPGGLGAARQASPRVLAGAAAVVVVVIVAIVLGIVLSGGGTSGSGGSGDAPTIHLATGTPAVGSSTSQAALDGATAVAAMFKGIPQDHFVLGQATAPVELTEFIDLQCPICKAFETSELPTLIQKYVRTDKLRIKMEPWSILDRPGTGVTDSDRGQKATIAAAAQNKAFTFAEMLYVNQGTEDSGWLNDAMISKAAASVDELEPAQLVSAANSAATQTIVQTVDSSANTLAAANTTGGFDGQGFIGTPGLFLAKGNGKLQFYGTGLPTLGNLESAIDALLK